MSMRYNAVDDYGLVIDEETGRALAKQFDVSYPENGNDWRYILYDEGICECISEFTGEMIRLLDDGSGEWLDTEFYNNDPISFVQVTHYPTLFKKAYNSMDEIINEIKDNIGEYFPEDFDYRNNIRKIVGTYYG